jgi:hypothetical protein
MSVTISAERNVTPNEAENKLTGKSLCIETERMWNMKCMTIPVITGTTGTETKSSKKNLEAIPGKNPID